MAFFAGKISVGTRKRGVLKNFEDAPCVEPKYAHLGAQEPEGAPLVSKNMTTFK